MKKRILFRFLALFMVVTITTSFISGCKSKSKETSVDKENVETTENNKEETKTNSDSDELIPISFARTTDASVESNIFAQTDESWEDNRWNQLFEDELGVDVVYKWVTTTADQGTQKLNAAIASGEIGRAHV